MKSAIFSSVLFFTFFAHVVFGHGYVDQMVIGGKVYNGPSPYGSAKLSSPIRKVTSTNPITNVKSSDMTCGINAASTAGIVAPAPAGSKLTFRWRQGSGAHWGHSIGPILTYMAKCPSSGCQGWNPKNADFFKISETGRKPNSMTWYMADIKAGNDYSTQIPKYLPNGDYIVRHELIALHFATSPGAAQLFPSCSQVRVTGGPNVSSMREVTDGVPAHFPGAYKATDPGIYTPKIYTSKSYSFPGPQVAIFRPPNSRRFFENSRSLNRSHHLNGTHSKNHTLPHHRHNHTTPLNRTTTTLGGSRIRPVDPLKLGSTVVVETKTPSPTNVETPKPAPEKREGGSTTTSSVNSTTSETPAIVRPWMPLREGSSVSIPEPTPSPPHRRRSPSPHPHRPVNARRAHHKRVDLDDGLQPRLVADSE